MSHAQNALAIVSVWLAVWAAAHQEHDISDLCVQSKKLNAEFLDRSLAKFSWTLFNKARAAASGGNVCIAPLSVAIALGMVQVGAKGATRDQLREHFHVAIYGSNLDWSPVAFYQLMNEINGDRSDYELSTANAVFADMRTFEAMVPRYGNIVARCLGSEGRGIDFNESEDARERINQWVEGETNHMIKDILAKGSLDEETTMILVNAIYFKAEWAKQFIKENRGSMYDGEFKPVRGDVQKATYMTRVGHYPYYEDDSVQVLGLPYKGAGNLTMYIILPKENSTNANEMEIDHKKVYDLLNAVKVDLVEVSMPMFSIAVDVDLKPLLKEMGITDMFDQKKADLSGMIENNIPPLFVSKAVHKAFVKVNINGTEAGAATVVTVVPSSRRPKNQFNAARPFVFAIVLDREPGGGVAPPAKLVLFHGLVARL